MKQERKSSCKRGSIECDHVLSLFDILTEKGFNLTGGLQYQSASAACLTMYMADLSSVAKTSAKDTSMSFVGYN